MSSKWKNNEELEYFLEYLRIPSVHPDVNYEPCVEYLRRQAATVNLPIAIYTPGGPTKPIVVMKWEGTEPTLPTIVLNSHMDVVPVFEDKWTHPPFAAVIDTEGRIFGRGTQDIKCAGIWYLSAIRALKKDGFKPKRTVYIIFVPDEEIGGKLGMGKFVQTDEFRALNIGFLLDEGMPNPKNKFYYFYGERPEWKVIFKCNGPAGHGAQLLQSTAAEKASFILAKMTEFRTEQIQQLDTDDSVRALGDVTTVNLTVMNGGKQSNVIPSNFTLTFDVRLSITTDHKQLENQLKQWCLEAGDDVELSFERKDSFVKPTAIDHTNPFWVAFNTCLVDELKLSMVPIVCPGATDCRYIRSLGIPGLGFSPLSNTPILVHAHDEFITVETFLKGIEIYTKLIANLANV